MFTTILLLLTGSFVACALVAARGAAVQDAVAGQRPASVVLRAAMIAREAATCTGWLAVAPFGWLDGRVPTPGASRPVLLVPHPGRNRIEMSALKTFLQRRHGRACWAMRLPADEVSLAEQAERVHVAARKLARWCHADHVDIVAHGAGGLAAAFAAHHLDDHGVIHRIVALGTPWHGTRTAVFEAGRLRKDLQPGSPALDEVLPCPVPLWSVWCPDDPRVVPADSAVADPDRSAAIDAAGHVGLMVSARALRVVGAALDEPLDEAVP